MTQNTLNSVDLCLLIRLRSDYSIQDQIRKYCCEEQLWKLNNLGEFSGLISKSGQICQFFFFFYHILHCIYLHEAKFECSRISQKKKRKKSYGVSKVQTHTQASDN